jgi:flavin reductase (DIM6/NTAB) family NADH-FMN oxidoreductase RutF
MYPRGEQGPFDPMIDGVSLAVSFRGAMRHLAGGVSVITVGRDKDITGMTVSSVSSLAIEPPTLIVSVNRNTSSWALLDRYGAFGINVLSAHHLNIAERFSGKGGVKGADRFAGAQWTSGGPTGVPLLVGALVAIECAVDDMIERHSHAIVIGRVLDLRVTEASGPLLYWHGEYLSAD